ncbi:hypothetical protein Tco_1077722 [Tanacetum coccineum]
MTRSKATPNKPSSLGTSSGGGGNTPRSDEDRLNLNELMEFCTKLQQRIFDLENTKTAQAQEITSLKLIEDASKQGRKINDIDKYAEITLVDETQGRYGDEEMFNTGVLDGDEVLAELEVTVKDVNLSVDEVTLAQALAALKSTKVQEKANVEKEPSESITKTPTLTTTTAATTIIAVKSQDKGKGIMVEEPVKMKKKDQNSLNEELAFKLQAEEEEKERLAREKA